MLEQCRLSIHLVGSGCGAMPDGPSQKSIVVLQNELAIQRCQEGGLKRVIWLPEGTTSQHAEQQRFMDALRQDASAQFGADLITADRETLKGVVRDVLQRLEKPTSAKVDLLRTAEGASLIYLICDERDRHASIPLRKLLRGAGFEVKIPLFDGDAATVRQANQDVLTECDAVLVFYGAGGEGWKRAVDSDLKKMRGYRGEKPLLASFVYLAEPATPDKNELIDLEEPNVMNGFSGATESALKPFLSALGRG
jgi:hypothetical protein